MISKSKAVKNFKSHCESFSYGKPLRVDFQSIIQFRDAQPVWLSRIKGISGWALGSFVGHIVIFKIIGRISKNSDAIYLCLKTRRVISEKNLQWVGIQQLGVWVQNTGLCLTDKAGIS
jgi:hypothetical protein